MGSINPGERRRALLAGALLIASSASASVSACAVRPPRLVPPPAGVEAVEGYGSAAISGAGASIKGKFGFVFRGAGLGRVEAVDPIGRTAFLIIFREGRAWFVLPGRKAYAEDAAEIMMERFLGLAIRPEEVVRLLSGTWDAADAAETGWRVDRDDQGRLSRGAAGDRAFAVKSFFPGDGVPREIGLEGPGSSGRLKILRLNFDPPPREEAFDMAFLRAYAARTWEEILDLVER
jgi:hypothetical protein